MTDGDTLRLRDGRRIRLLQIDAPEKLEQCYGLQATVALSRLAPEGTQVRLVADPRLDRRDSFGRLLRYVFAEGRNVNLELVRTGAASPYLYRNERGRYSGSLLEAARDARAAERGYWGACPRARLEPGLGAVTGPPR